LLVGLLIKLSLNIPLIKAMETQGAVLATALGYAASIIINFIVIKMYSGYRFRLVARRCLLIVIFAGIMWLGTEITLKILELFLSPASKIQALIIILICGVVGAGIYFYLSLKTRLAYRLFGSRVDTIKKKLRLPI
jgi:O-antigen/teichoic acid export membrane protein